MSLNENRIEKMRERLIASLEPDLLEIIDDSARHAGHAGAKTGLGHFKMIISSAAFTGKSPIARHRLVYRSLGEMMQADIHALNIDARLPG
ncbi:MAG: BolA family transcriptional regulator [Xanthomonadales bacterium]|nr:BolA family transcriptional regulator [Xanthomonadales bacterium]